MRSEKIGTHKIPSISFFSHPDYTARLLKTCGEPSARKFHPLGAKCEVLANAFIGYNYRCGISPRPKEFYLVLARCERST